MAIAGANVANAQSASVEYESCLRYMSLLFIGYLVLVVLLDYVYIFLQFHYLGENV